MPKFLSFISDMFLFYSSIFMNNQDVLLGNPSKNMAIDNSLIHHGRSLMSVSDDPLNNDTGPDISKQKHNDAVEATVKQFRKTMKFLNSRRLADDWSLLKDVTNVDLSMCPHYLNSTESQRFV